MSPPRPQPPKPVLPEGYSGTPVLKKLGIKPGQLVFINQPPATYLQRLSDELQLLYGSTDLQLQTSPDQHTQLVQLFVCTQQALDAWLVPLRQSLKADAVIWVSWPKKTARARFTEPVDLTEDLIRSQALPLGLVDIKVCAVDDCWSGLKLMLRRELRG
jgi:hypothetical protein